MIRCILQMKGSKVVGKWPAFNDKADDFPVADEGEEIVDITGNTPDQDPEVNDHYDAATRLVTKAPENMTTPESNEIEVAAGFSDTDQGKVLKAVARKIGIRIKEKR